MSAPSVLRFADPLGPRGRRRVTMASIVAVVALTAVFLLGLRRFAENGQLAAKLWSPLFTPEARTFYAVGLWNTLRAATVAGVLSVVFGVLLAVLRLSPVAWQRRIVIAWMEFFRGIPLLLLVIFLYFGLPRYGIDPGRYWFLVMGLTLYHSAVIAEIVRAGILSLDRGQTEAGLAVGLSSRQTLRFVLLPQALRRMLPALVSQLVVILKDTSLGFTIGYEELLRRSQLAGANLGNPLQALMLGAAIYLTVNLIFSLLARWLEGRQKRGRGLPGPIPTTHITTLGEAAIPVTDLGRL
jgi:glutamate transport system permease protein